MAEKEVIFRYLICQKGIDTQLVVLSKSIYCCIHWFFTTKTVIKVRLL